MPGGLIQISKYGSRNLFLTGNPEITFFKSVYKRYTNFSIESKSLNFNNGINFNQISSLEIPINGDLLYKMYLELHIPEIKLDNYITENEDISINYNIYVRKYNAIKRFIKLNMLAFRHAYVEYLPENIITSENIITAINNIFNDDQYSKNPIFTEEDPYVSIIDEENSTSIHFETNEEEVLFLLKEEYSYIWLNENLDKYINNEDSLNNENNLEQANLDAENYAEVQSTLIYNSCNILKSIENVDNIDSKFDIINILNETIKNVKDLDKFWSDILKSKKKELDESINNNIQFAWVDNLGTSLIEYVEIEINGMTIDRQYGIWLDIWKELTIDNKKMNTYNIMNGNVPELTEFNKNVKPAYKILIPLNFWFNKMNSVAFPLVSLRDQNLKFNVRFRKFSDCCYIDENSIIKFKFSNNTDFKLDDLVNEEIIKLNGNLVCDFIYLDENERALFAQTKHNYLIEQVYLETFENIVDKNLMINLEFLNPVKELVWILQDNKYITKINDGTKLEWNKYDINNQNPIFKSELLFNDWTRTMNMDYKYYNYIQPMKYHTRTPKKGINVYSFSLNPESLNPSGYCSIKYITDKRMKFEIDENIFQNNNKATLFVFALSYNVLRIENGTANIIFV
jgi:hypothetical protein